LVYEADKQPRHEKLIEFLSQFSQYSTEDGKPRLKKVKTTRHSGVIEKINPIDVNLAVVVFTDIMNITMAFQD
jgi:hypothetical protein